MLPFKTAVHSFVRNTASDETAPDKAGDIMVPAVDHGIAFSGVDKN